MSIGAVQIVDSVDVAGLDEVTDTIDGAVLVVGVCAAYYIHIEKST